MYTVCGVKDKVSDVESVLTASIEMCRENVKRKHALQLQANSTKNKPDFEIPNMKKDYG